MTWLGTRETREARIAAQAAEADEKEHRRDCVTCIRAVRQRQPESRCDAGRELDKARRETAAQLKRERDLDKLPIPGQEPLFEVAEVARAAQRDP